MEKIKFNKEELVNLGFCLQREFLLTSGSGAFATSTLSLCNTRKYHGLLIARQPKIDNEWHVLLSSLDETIVERESEFHLALHHYQNDTYYPKGHKYLESFEQNKTVKLTYKVANIEIEKELLMPCQDNRLLVRYNVKSASEPFELRISPLLAFRQRHKLMHSNSGANTDYSEADNGKSFCLYEGYDKVFMQFSKKGVSYTNQPEWYYNFHYIRETQRGYEAMEDLLCSGYFTTKLKKGDTIILSVGTKEIESAKISTLWTSELRKKEPIKDFESMLRAAARQFFVSEGGKTEVMAGFPWFERWGRDTFIALPGLCIGLNNTALMKQVIDTMIEDMHGGLFPNIGSKESAAYNSVDAPMWFFYSLQQYSLLSGKKKEVWKEYKEVMLSILNAYRHGVGNTIRMEENGLIWASEDGRALTWMDAVVDGLPVTQRKGFCVEINALWYNAIMFSLSLAQESKDKEFINEWKPLAEKIPNSFKETFWDKSLGWLADYVDGYFRDLSVRPNMVLATCLSYTPLSEKIRQLIIERIEKELLIPYGLRTLSPTHSDYKGMYEGDQKTRDLAYHQGTAWVWLLSHFVEGYLKIYGKEGLPLAREIYSNFEKEMTSYGIGTIAEVFDGNPPYRAGGSIAQAWSVSEVIRIKYLIDKYEKEGGGQ